MCMCVCVCVWVGVYTGVKGNDVYGRGYEQGWG